MGSLEGANSCRARRLLVCCVVIYVINDTSTTCFDRIRSSSDRYCCTVLLFLVHFLKLGVSGYPKYQLKKEKSICLTKFNNNLELVLTKCSSYVIASTWSWYYIEGLYHGVRVIAVDFILWFTSRRCRDIRLCTVWIMNSIGCGRKRSWSNLRDYPGIFLEVLRETAKNLSYDSRCWSRD
jgi:hypothetical protein